MPIIFNNYSATSMTQELLFIALITYSTLLVNLLSLRSPYLSPLGTFLSGARNGIRDAHTSIRDTLPSAATNLARNEVSNTLKSQFFSWYIRTRQERQNNIIQQNIPHPGWQPIIEASGRRICLYSAGYMMGKQITELLANNTPVSQTTPPAAPPQQQPAR